MSVHKLKDGRWICKFPKDKGFGRKYFGRGAAAEGAARAHDRGLGLRSTRPRAEDQAGPLLADLCISYMEDRGFSSGSLQMTTWVMQTKIVPMLGHIPAVRLTHSDLSRYVRDRRQSVKSNTTRREVVIIQAVLNWAAGRRPALIPLNPLRGFALPENDDDVIDPPTASEVARIMEHANERLKRFITIAWYTGVRPGLVELLKLQWDTVNWETSSIRVRSANKGGVRSRSIPIHPGFLPVLKEWHQADAANGWHTGSIVNRKGRSILSVKGSWDLAKKKAGIDRRLRLYDMRHLYATVAIEAGCDYKTLSDVMGSNPETLRRHYQHVSDAARVNLIGRMPAMDLTR